MGSDPVPFFLPSLGEEEIAQIVETLTSGWITTGPKAQQFEQQFADLLGVPAALALNSCTSALHLALVTLGIKAGDAVITTPLTFCSGVHVIEHVGATPVLVDVEPDTLNIDPSEVVAAIERVNRQTNLSVKAIIPVHLHGHPCEMDALLSIASDYGLAVIEDCAHALPARYRGRMIGCAPSHFRLPLFSCFSFYATKNLTTAEGGMLVTNSGHLDEARVWSLHGMSRDAWKRYGPEGSWFYEVVQPGFKYNMTDIQAALGLAQMSKLAAFQTRRHAIARRYNEAFSECEQLVPATERAHVEHAWHLYNLRLNLAALKVDRNEFVNELKSLGIATSVHFIPIHLHAYYRDKYGYSAQDFPVAYAEYQRMFSLPIYPGMTEHDVDRVIEAVMQIVRKNTR